MLPAYQRAKRSGSAPAARNTPRAAAVWFPDFDITSMQAPPTDKERPRRKRPTLNVSTASENTAAAYRQASLTRPQPVDHDND